MITKRRLCLRVLRLAALDGEFAKLHASAALREGSSPPGLRLPKAKLSRKSNQVARGRIRRFESDMPSHPVGLRVAAVSDKNQRLGRNDYCDSSPINVRDLYAEAPDPKRPVVCFDESPLQLIGEVRQPISAVPGQIERYDCEYRRNGTANLFAFLDVNRPWRKVKVTKRRAAEDFAACMRDLTDVQLSWRRAHSRGARQLVDPFARCVLSDLPGR
jgi:DDE superfamily endonuclease